MSTQGQSLLEVEAGLFETKSIVGEGFLLRPKGFNPGQLKKCVYRQDHVAAIMGKLQVMVKEVNKDAPGLYLQGPAGVGKSILVYTITQIAKFRMGWLTVYVPHCKAWRQNNDPIRAMAFFLDRVRDALSLDVMQEKFSELWKKLDGPIEEGRFGSWVKAVWVPEEKEKVEPLFHDVMDLLRAGHQEAAVLLVFDEVNALDEKMRSAEPWSILDFDDPALVGGALLVSGTTDSEFVSSIPAGYDRTYQSIYNVTEFQPEETESLLDTELGTPLKRIRDFDPKLWHEIADACGNMPRDLEGYAMRLRDLSSEIFDGMAEPARKKIKVDICTAIEHQKEDNRIYHRGLFQNAIRRDQQRNENVFEEELLAWCNHYFLENKLHGSLQILRAPNFIVQDTQMHPTTVDAAQAYFDWFVQKSKEREPASVVQSLATICAENTDANGSERVMLSNVSFPQNLLSVERK